MIQAVLFDIDGTLIDSVDLHTQAWREALARYGKQVAADRIHHLVGMGGDRITAELLTEDEDASFGEELAELRADVFARRYLLLAKPFPGARELLVALKRAGVLVGLASSCTRQELGHHLRLLDGASVVDAATSADDAAESKPAPEVFTSCLDRLALDPGDAVAVGDSPHDAMSAGRAGLVAVGVLSGGFTERVLRSAGCVKIHAGCGELLQHLHEEPFAVAPVAHAG